MRLKHFLTATSLILLFVFFNQNEKDEGKEQERNNTIKKVTDISKGNHVGKSKKSLKDKDQYIDYSSNKKVDPSKLAKTADRLSYYFNCLEFQQCESIPSDDPRMYEITVGEHILEEIKTLRKKSDLNKTEKDFMVKALKMMNGHVQAEALKYFEQLPLSSENLNHIVEGLNNSDYDVVLMQDAMPLLNRYFKQPETSGLVFDFVTKQISQGSYLSSEYFAKNLSTFLNEDNLQEIERLVNDLPKEKSNLKYLKSAIENFKLMQSGG